MIDCVTGYLVAAKQYLARRGGSQKGKTSPDDFTFMKMLGQGGFDKVLLPQLKSLAKPDHDRLCAVKVLKKGDVIKGK